MGKLGFFLPPPGHHPQLNPQPQLRVGDRLDACSVRPARAEGVVPVPVRLELAGWTRGDVEHEDASSALTAAVAWRY